MRVFVVGALAFVGTGVVLLMFGAPPLAAVGVAAVVGIAASLLTPDDDQNEN
jgi:hypothetical protein